MTQRIRTKEYNYISAPEIFDELRNMTKYATDSLIINVYRSSGKKLQITDDVETLSNGLNLCTIIYQNIFDLIRLEPEENQLLLLRRLANMIVKDLKSITLNKGQMISYTGNKIIYLLKTNK